MIGRVYSVVIDTPDPRALAEFYTAVTGMPRTRDEDNWVMIGDSPGPYIAFQRAPELQPPRWPDPDFPQQFHLDIEVDDVEVAEAKVLALGARRLPGEGEDFRVYADPAGHPFCLVWS